MPTISSLRMDQVSMEVLWDDGISTRYPWIWLRDHAHDANTMHPVTQQRQLYTAALPTDLCGVDAQLRDGDVCVSWSDATPPSSLPESFLATHRQGAGARTSMDATTTLWDATTLGSGAPTVLFDDVMTSDDALGDWLAKVAEFGFCLAIGTPADVASTEALLRRIGYVRETIFGGMFEFTADLSKADTAYTNLELRPHTDGTYSHDAPGVQLLHCLSFEGTGGESTVVDAFAIAHRMRRDSPEHFRTLSSVAVPGQYIGDGSHLMAARPIIRHDHTGALVQVSFNNYDRAPFLLPEDEMLAFYAALREFDTLANDISMQWRHVLAPGEALLFDNWRVLHGRRAFTGARRLCGGYLNREDVDSRRRRLV